MSSKRGCIVPKFHVGDIVYASYGSTVYKAKIRKVSEYHDRDIPSYYLKFVGWADCFNKWQSEKDIYSNADEFHPCPPRDDITESLRKSYRSKKRKKKKSSEREANGYDVENKSKPNSLKRKSDNDIDPYIIGDGCESCATASTSENFHSFDWIDEEELCEAQFQFNISNQLKCLMYKDGKWINQNKKLVKLPAEHTIEFILDEYMEASGSKKAVSDQRKTDCRVWIETLKKFFNGTLSNILAYNEYEQEQIELLASIYEHQDFCSIYGIEHFVRLIYIIPQYLTPVTRAEAKRIQAMTNDLLKFIATNKDKYFTWRYMPRSMISTLRHQQKQRRQKMK